MASSLMDLFFPAIQGGSTKGGLNSVAPIYDLNTPYGRSALEMTLSAGGQGDISRGLDALQPLDLRINTPVYGGVDNTPGMDIWKAQEHNPRALAAAQANAMRLGLPGVQGMPNWQALFDPMANKPGTIGWEGNNIGKFWDNANTQLGDLYRIQGLSSGWDGGKNGARGAARTLYRMDNGVLSPVSSPAFYNAPEHKGWAREEGSDFLQAMSMVMPAFGGWGGILGAGGQAAGGIGSGLGLTNSLSSVLGGRLTNALVNTLGNAIMTGNSGGILPGLVGSLGTGALGGLASGQGLGNLFSGGPNIGAPSYSNLGQFLSSPVGQSFMQTPAMRGQFGQLFRGVRGLQGNSFLNSLFGG